LAEAGGTPERAFAVVIGVLASDVAFAMLGTWLLVMVRGRPIEPSEGDARTRASG
jgi:hypothetical protein